MKQNYYLEYEKQIQNVCDLEKRPTLLLHSCCGPCSSAVLEELCKYFEVTVFFYNPNIDTKEEYDRRLDNQKKIIEYLPCAKAVKLIDGGYDREGFLAAVKGYETQKEGGARCEICFVERLRATRDAAEKYDYFSTTLTVSPHKNAQLINTIGKNLENGGARFLVADFKKKEGYKRSIILSKQYDLYRQTYCGCEFSK